MFAVLAEYGIYFGFLAIAIALAYNFVKKLIGVITGKF